jgi:hypothetical protein
MSGGEVAPENRPPSTGGRLTEVEEIEEELERDEDLEEEEDVSTGDEKKP